VASAPGPGTHPPDLEPAADLDTEGERLAGRVPVRLVVVAGVDCQLPEVFAGRGHGEDVEVAAIALADERDAAVEHIAGRGRGGHGKEEYGADERRSEAEHGGLQKEQGRATSWNEHVAPKDSRFSTSALWGNDQSG
jgi:hypothetical protein